MNPEKLRRIFILVFVLIPTKPDIFYRPNF